MSRAFIRESDGDDTPDLLPDRPVSPHPNWVTAVGLAMMEAEIRALAEAQSAAQAANDKQALATAARDLRYWTARRATAEVIARPTQTATVAFGSEVTIERDDGRRQTYRIVGEDEADPRKGTLSYVSPLARALLGKSVGDVVSAGKSEADIVEIAC
ncbi:MAG: transcription elongation factor GreA [Hyphomicrobiaceae bacterium]